MEIAVYISLVLVGAVLIGLVVIQGRTAGLQSRDSGSIYRTKRGLEKTIHQATIILAAVFLLLALIASLPIFGGPTAAPATGLLIAAGLL